MCLILIAEDELDIAETISLLLEKQGYEVITAPDGTEALRLARERQPDLMILDWNLPGIEGVAVCGALRRENADAPVMILTARDAEFDKVVAFTAGADDYVTKPFGLLEFLSRVKALLRRRRIDSSVLRLGDLTMDLASHQVTLGGEQIVLTPKEYNLLAFLAENVGKAVTRETLLHKVWGYNFYGNTRTVDVHVSRLRAKLGDDNNNPTRILTVKTVGYKLVPMEAEQKIG